MSGLMQWCSVLINLFFSFFLFTYFYSIFFYTTSLVQWCSDLIFVSILYLLFYSMLIHFSYSILFLWRPRCNSAWFYFLFLSLFIFFISHIFSYQVFDLWFVRCLSILVDTSAKMSRFKKGISLHRHSPVAPLIRVWRFVSRLRRAVYDSPSFATVRFRVRFCFNVHPHALSCGPTFSSYKTKKQKTTSK